MNATYLWLLRRTTPEEKAILSGQNTVQRDIYTNQANFIIEHEKLLASNRLITVRKHTRFVDFPPHTHNYVEFFYVLSGSVTHVIDEREITIYPGELLFMNQYVRHGIRACGEDDLAVNLIIKPKFFELARQMVSADNILADFMINTLQQENSTAQYLYFPVAVNPCIQNLMDNIVYSILHEQQNMERILETTMGLMFLHLLNTAEKAQILTPDNESINMLTLTVQQYIKDEYRSGTLQDLAKRIGYSQSSLSRLIKKYTGMNFKEMQAKQRLQCATELLYGTKAPVSEIAAQVGYENQSFFYKLFQKEYGITPKEARERVRKKQTT